MLLCTGGKSLEELTTLHLWFTNLEVHSFKPSKAFPDHGSYLIIPQLIHQVCKCSLGLYLPYPPSWTSSVPVPPPPPCSSFLQHRDFSRISLWILKCSAVVTLGAERQHGLWTSPDVAGEGPASVCLTHTRCHFTKLRLETCGSCSFQSAEPLGRPSSQSEIPRPKSGGGGPVPPRLSARPEEAQREAMGFPTPHPFLWQGSKCSELKY